MANKLASISGWQQERRRALALLTAQIKRASARCDWATLDALHAARWDVRASLAASLAALLALCACGGGDVEDDTRTTQPVPCTTQPELCR